MLTQDRDAGASTDPKSAHPVQRRGCGHVGGIVISNLYRLLLLGVIVTLIVLVSINVRRAKTDPGLIPGRHQDANGLHPKMLSHTYARQWVRTLRGIMCSCVEFKRPIGKQLTASGRL